MQIVIQIMRQSPKVNDHIRPTFELTIPLPFVFQEPSAPNNLFSADPSPQQTPHNQAVNAPMPATALIKSQARRLTLEIHLPSLPIIIIQPVPTVLRIPVHLLFRRCKPQIPIYLFIAPRLALQNNEIAHRQLTPNPLDPRLHKKLPQVQYLRSRLHPNHECSDNDEGDWFGRGFV